MTSPRLNRLLPFGLMLAAMIPASSLADAPEKPEKSHDAAVARNLSTFNAIVKELELNYVDSIRPKEAFGAAISAFLSTVDPYTEYYDADDKSRLRQMTTGELDFAGIGSMLMADRGGTVISYPMEWAPAAKAGIRNGDKILRVDSIDTSSMTPDQVTKYLRGEAGTPVSVIVSRPFVADSILTFDMVRTKIVEPSVPYWGVVDGNTGYIRLTQFIEGSAEDVRKALESFKENPAVDKIVLDLRGNGGGLVESAIDIVGNFVPKGTEVLRTKGRGQQHEKVYKTTRTPIFSDIPLAVLINGGSASASEITAGSLQDLDRAVIIGTRSYGKGLVQGTMQLPYDGLLKVTVAKYYIPSGRLIQALDYSRRNPDGSVARTPDSLTNVYKTLHGREVRDGGGLTPDIKVNWDKVSRLTYNLVGDRWIWNFANEYANTHDSIPSPWDFDVTDEIFEAFKNSVDTVRFKNDKKLDDSDRDLDELMAELRKVASEEGYLDSRTAAALDSLAPLLSRDVMKDMDNKRGELSEYLGAEIAQRYYFDSGKLLYDLKFDNAFKKAREILSDPAALARTLGREIAPVKTKNKKRK